MSAASDIFATAREQIREIFGESVTYIAGDLEIEIDEAVRVNGSRPEQIEGSVAHDHTEQEWRIAAAELVRDDVTFEPQAGHRIVWVTGGRTLTYTVQPKNGQQCFDYGAGGRDQLKIYTKETGVS